MDADGGEVESAVVDGEGVAEAEVVADVVVVDVALHMTSQRL